MAKLRVRREPSRCADLRFCSASECAPATTRCSPGTTEVRLGGDGFSMVLLSVSSCLRRYGDFAAVSRPNLAHVDIYSNQLSLARTYIRPPGLPHLF